MRSDAKRGFEALFVEAKEVEETKPERRRKMRGVRFQRTLQSLMVFDTGRTPTYSILEGVANGENHRRVYSRTS
jgi:hypothetical protein